MPKKQITNEDLGRMIKKGFDGIESRFDRIDKKLDILEQGQKKIIRILDKGT